MVKKLDLPITFWSGVFYLTEEVIVDYDPENDAFGIEIWSQSCKIEDTWTIGYKEILDKLDDAVDTGRCNKQDKEKFLEDIEKVRVSYLSDQKIIKEAENLITLQDYNLDQENGKFVIFDQQTSDYLYNYENEKYYNNLAKALERRSQQILDFLEQDIEDKSLDNYQKERDRFLIAFLHADNVYKTLRKIKPERKI